MNHYNSYKLRKLASQLFDSTISFIFYIPRHQYVNNEKFKNWIDSRQDMRSDKQQMKRIMDKVFREIGDNDDGLCKIFTTTDYDNEIPCDLSGWDYKILLDTDDWIKKNKLEVEKLSFYDYIMKYYPTYEKNFNNYYHWSSHKNEIVLVIRRK